MTDTRDISARPNAPCTAHEMHGHAPAGSSDTWIFNIEAVSTLCIAGWYLYGVFISLGLLPNVAFYHWGSTWVVPFLLGIFYAGAGYLYQQHQRIHSVAAWGHYMKREFIVLATPFVAFTVLVLATNSIVHGTPSLSIPNLASALTLDPVVPVGYFEVLFFIYVLTRTPQSMRGMIGLLAVACAAKIAIALCNGAGISTSWIYAAREIPENWIWFVCGVAIRFFGLKRWLARPRVGLGSTLAFAGCALLLYAARSTHPLALCVLTALALCAAFSLSAERFSSGRQDAFFGFVTRYTMAIWLMHELLAKLVMAGLGVLGFTNSAVLGAACLIACYGLPIVAMGALSHIGKLGFIVYPSRYLPKSL